MGNLRADSGIRSIYYEEAKKYIIGLLDIEYVNQVNDGRYPEYKFVYDGVGFGLANWTYYVRKQALLETCRGNIGDLACQLRYLKAELINYFPGVISLLKTSNSVWDCTIKVLVEFENPLDQSLSVQNYRYLLALDYYNTFAGVSIPTPGPSGNTYTVQYGDTLSGIAYRFGTTVAILCQLNGLPGSKHIYVGQVLRLP